MQSAIKPYSKCLYFYLQQMQSEVLSLKVKVLGNAQEVSTSKPAFRGIFRNFILGMLQLISTFRKKPSNAPGAPSTH